MIFDRSKRKKLKEMEELFDVEGPAVIAGKAGVGKTNFILYLASKSKNPVVIDTEHGVSSRRAAAFSYSGDVVRISSWKNMLKLLDRLQKKNIDFLAIDSISFFYRIKLLSDVDEANKWLVRTFKLLHEIAEKSKVIASVHVYEEDGKMKMSGGDIVAYMARAIFMIEKKKDTRRISILKHPWAEDRVYADFRINEGGLLGL